MDTEFYTDILTIDATPRDVLDSAAAAIFALFLEREREFGFNPAVVTEYPDISNPDTSSFLNAPLDYIIERCQALDTDDESVIRVVILTTYGERLYDVLVAADFEAVRIDMPAGPDQTYAFFLDRPVAENGRTLYLEAVNEADEKIRPTFAITMTDETGRLCGGACGAVHERDGVRYAYLATMSLAAGLPKGSGTRLAGALLAFLRTQDVKTIHLGTQTAGPFYERIGFSIVHRLVPALRTRRALDGSDIAHDLVLMKADI